MSRGVEFLAFSTG